NERLTLGQGHCVAEHLAHESVHYVVLGLRSFGVWNREPGRREKRSYVAAPAAVPAVVAGRMPVVRGSQLSATVRQVRQANFFGTFLDYVVNAAPRNRRQILAIRIARSILNRAGNAHVPLGLRKPRRNLRVVHRPVFVEPIQVCSLEIDVAVTSGRTSPEIGFAASCLAALPIPIGARTVGICDVVLEEILSFTVLRL